MGTFAPIIWTLLLLVSWASAGPVQLTSCAAECRTPLSPKFRHSIGQTYVYQFNGQTKTSVVGTSADEALLQINAQVWMTFRSACDVVVQLKETTVAGLDDTVDSSELEKRPLLVSWQDGLVESVCPHHSDPAWAVNIKRGVLSMLQHTSQFLDVSEKNVVENDVIGRCPTSYEVESGSVSEGAPITLIKTKVPNQCSHRVGRHSAIPTVAYDVAAEVQSMPLMNSTSVCRQFIKNGIVESVECQEAHMFRPLSTENGGGAQTEVTSTLKFVSARDASAVKIAGDFEKSTLIFDASGHFDVRGAKDLSTLVKSLCNQLASESQVPVAQLFTELVHSLRRSSPKEVKAAYANMLGKKNCPEMPKTEKMFLDALPQAGSPGAVALMADLIKEEKISKRQSLGWFLSLPLSKFVTAESIKAVLPLVDSVSESPMALLSISGMARRFCTENREQCESNSEIQQLSTKFGKLLGNKCQNDDLRVISALKAIGNLGVMSQDVLQTINTCIKEDKLPVSTRVAAIEATRNSPCIKPIKEALLDILANKEEDNEVRIAAYLAVMRCPCSASLLRIQSILAVEEYNQVGSFIMSHMDNLKQNKSPAKQHVRRLINKLQLDRSFKVDLRKYSRNFANSHFCSVDNAGWDLDVNVVYSTKSFLPRSASMNLTVDLFGHSVNLFEIGARMENVERVLEHYLGPDGSIQKEGMAGLWSKMSDAMRIKRGTVKSGDLNTIDKMVELKDMKDSIKFDAFVRVFGSEIAMMHYRSEEAPKSADMWEDVQTRLSKAVKELIEGAKHVEIDVARSLMFLDTAATFPTIAGVPIKLAVNGTTTVGLGLESNVDISALLRDPENADLKFKINPLAVTELSASMTVDMAIAKTGVKMVANIHSSAAADLTAKMVKGSSFDLKLELPKTKITAVEIKSELLLIQQKDNDAERAKKLTIDNEVSYNHGGCSERLSHITGIRVCAVSSMSVVRPHSECSKDKAPMFPLSGYGSASFAIEKIDPAMQGYTLSAQIKEDAPKSRSLTVIVDTPGSSTARKMVFKGLLATEPDVVAKVEAKTPWGVVAVESELVNRAELKSLMVKINQEQKRYLAKVALKVQTSGEHVAYDSTVEIETPAQPLAVVLEGRLGYAPGNSLEMKMKPVGPLARLPMSFDAAIKSQVNGESRRFAVERLDVTSPLGKVEFASESTSSPVARSLTVSMKYGAEKQHQMSFNGKIEKQTAEGAHAYSTVATYKSSRFPVTNFDLKWDLEMAPATVKNTLVLLHGPESEHAVNRLSISQQSINKGRMMRDLMSENKFEISYPLFSVDLKMEQQLQFDDRSIKGLVLVMYNKNRMVDGSLNFVFMPTDSRTFYQIDGKLALPGRSIELRDVGKKLDDNTFTISPVLTMVPGGKHELSAKVIFVRDATTSVNIESELRLEGFSNPIKIRHSFQMSEDMTITTNNKFEWAGQPQMTVDGKIALRSPVPAVEINMLWNGRFDGRLESRLSPRDAMLNMNMKFLRFDRRVKINAMFKNEGERRAASFNAAWDADKDAKSQFGLEFDLAVPTTTRAVELKSVLSVMGSRYALSANGKLSSDPMNGENLARFELELPSADKLVFNAVANNVNTERKISNRWSMDLSLPANKEYHFDFNNIISDLNKRTFAFNAVSELELRTPLLEKINARWEIKRIVRDEERSSDLKLTINAPKFGPIIDASATIEVMKDTLKLVSKFQRGSTLFTIESQNKLTNSGTKTNYDGFLEVKSPKTSWEQFKIAGVSSFDISSAFNFDISDKITIQYQNTKTIVMDGKMKLSSGSMDMSLNIETPFTTARRQGLSVSGRVDNDTPKYEGSAIVTWSHPEKRDTQKISMEFEIERRVGQSITVKVSAASPIERFESVDIRFDGRRLNEGQALEGDLSVDVSSRKFEMKAKLNMDNKQPEIDVIVIRGSENPLRFFGRVQTQSVTKTIETRIDWGQGSININGKGKFVDMTNFEVTLNVESPTLESKKMEITLVNKPEKKRRNVELIIKKQSTVVSSIKIELLESSASHLKGNVDMTYESTIANAFKFDLAKKEIDSSDKGRELKGEIEFTSGSMILKKMSANMKWTQREKSGVWSICSVSNNCISPSFLLKDTSSGSKSNQEAHMLIKWIEGSAEEVQGLRYKHQASGSKLEQVAEMILSQKSNENDKDRLIGYKANRDGNQFSLELYTPIRKIGVSAEQVKGPKNSLRSTIAVWMDKVCDSESRLVIVNTMEPHKLGDMEGMTTVTTIKHPMLTRDLEYKIDYHMAKNERAYNRFHVKVDADVMDSKHQRIVMETYVRGKINDKTARNITIETEVRSKGTDVSALTIFSGAVSEQSISLSGNLKFSDKGRVEKELIASVDATANSASVTVGSPAKQMSFEGRWNMGHVVGHRHLQFSGYSQVFNMEPLAYVVDLSSAPHVDIRVFRKATPEKHYNIRANFVDDSRFEMALGHQTGAQKKDLAAVYLTLNRTDLLHSRITWNTPELRALVEAARSRSIEVAREIRTTLEPLSSELTPIVAKWAIEGDKAKDLASGIKQRAQCIREGIAADESVKAAAEVVVAFKSLIDDMEVIFDGLDIKLPSFDNVFAKMTESLREVSEKFAEYRHQMADTLSNPVEDFLRIFEEMKAFIMRPDGLLNKVLAFSEDFFTRFGGAIEQIRMIIDGRYKNLEAWLNTIEFLDERIVELLKKLMSPEGRMAVREKFFRFIEEDLMEQIKLALRSFAEKYPETKRIMCRMESRMDKLRNYIDELKKVREEKPVESKKTNEPRQWLKKAAGEMIVYDPQAGEIQYQLPLWRHIPSLRHLTSMWDISAVTVKSVTESESEYDTLSDAFLRLRAKYDPMMLKSRVRGFASIIGSTGYITFDKKAFDMNVHSNCQYLLARDFLNKDFTLAVNFDDSVGKTIIFADQDDQVEIRNKEILVNNRAVSLPVTLKSITIRWDGETVVVERSHGVVLRCDQERDTCSLDISPFYTGRVMGMLGTFNNEVADDMKLPSGKIAKDASQFVSSWKLNKACKEKELKVQMLPASLTRKEQSTKEAQSCQEWFRDNSSPLRSCFGVVSPSPYYELCVKSVDQAKKVNSKRPVVSTATAYIAACERFGITSLAAPAL